MAAVLLIIALAYGVFRINRATVDIKRATLTSQALVDAAREYERSTAVVNSVGKLVGVREASGIAEAIIDIVADGEVGRFKEAVNYAKRCDEDLDGDHTVIDRLLYSQPVSCRRMFKTLGEPGELADAGVTFADAAQRLVPAGPPGSMDGPACRTWAIESVSFKVPKTKRSGEAWDVFDGPPDPSLLLKVGSATHRGPKIQDTWSYAWSPARAIETTPATKIQIAATDEDLAEPDHIFGYEVTLPTNLPGPTWTVGEFEIEIACRG